MNWNWFHSYEKDLAAAFDQAETILSGLPEEFRGHGLNYLGKFHALKKSGSQNYICYLLPFWMQEAAGAKPELSRELTVAMILVMLHYHLIDEVMDNPEAGDKWKLPLANLLQLEFTRIYAALYASDSPFWSYYRKYAAEWAKAVLLENQHDFFQDNPVRIAHKASPVKLSVAGMLLLTEHDRLIAPFEAAVDAVLVTLQMLDDWEDWEKDLREGSYNSLISVVQHELQIPSDRRPTPDEVKHALHVRDILFIFAERTDQNAAILEVNAPGLTHLHEFHDYLRTNLRQGAESLRDERSLLAQGGLAYWLANQKILS